MELRVENEAKLYCFASRYVTTITNNIIAVFLVFFLFYSIMRFKENSLPDS